MLPVIALTDLDDAQLVFDVLNNAAVQEQDTERRQRLNVLLIATHSEVVRLRKS